MRQNASISEIAEAIADRIQERGTWITGHSLDALLQAAKRQAWAECLEETGPSAGMLTQREGESFEQFALRKAQWVARQRERYDARAKQRYPILLPDGSTP